MWHRRHFVVFQPLSLLLFLPGSRRPKKGEKGPKSTFFYLFFFFDLAAWRLKASNARQFNSKRSQFFPHFFLSFFPQRQTTKPFIVLPSPKKRERHRERVTLRSADILLLVNSRRRGLNNASNKKTRTRFSLIFELTIRRSKKK